MRRTILWGLSVMFVGGCGGGGSTGTGGKGGSSVVLVDGAENEPDPTGIFPHAAGPGLHPAGGVVTSRTRSISR